MATSPFVSPPLAEAGSALTRRLAPMAPAPTAAPFSRNERRSVMRQDCSAASMIFSFRVRASGDVHCSRRWRTVRLRPTTALHNRPLPPPDRAGRSALSRVFAAVRQLPVRAREVAVVPVGVALQVVLVLGLGLPERTGRADLGHDLASPETRRVDVGDRVLGDLALLVAREEDL